MLLMLATCLGALSFAQEVFSGPLLSNTHTAWCDVGGVCLTKYLYLNLFKWKIFGTR